MPLLVRAVPPPVLDLAHQPRHDVVVEIADGPDRFVAASGPFTTYERTLHTGADATVEEHINYEVAPLVWGPFPWLYRRALAGPVTPGHRPWWFPPETTDARGATVMGGLTLLAVILGYLSSVLTQTITFAAEEFGAGKPAQSATLAAVRIGVLGALALAALADRRGRRRVLLWATTTACGLSAVSALAPDLVTLGILQALVRGAVTAAIILLTIVAVEEMPSGSRAFGISLLSVTGALGAGLVLFALPIADTSTKGWRVIFVLPLLFLPVILRIARVLPESQRFMVAHARARIKGHGRRLGLLATSAFLLALFTAPASQLMNEFLRNERGFSAARISLFLLLTNTPGGIGIVMGGRLADTRGRRQIGAIGTIGGASFTVATVLAHGWPMWALSVMGSVIGAMVIPALGVFGPELFPTSLRGKANGIITIGGVGGSVVGLLAAGVLSARWDGLGPALTVLAIGPMTMAALVLVAYPETAHRELEDINPEDRLSPPS